MLGRPEVVIFKSFHVELDPLNSSFWGVSGHLQRQATPEVVSRLLKALFVWKDNSDGGSCSLRGGNQVTKGFIKGGLNKVFRYLTQFQATSVVTPKGLEEPSKPACKPRKLASHHLYLVTLRSQWWRRLVLGEKESWSFGEQGSEGLNNFSEKEAGHKCQCIWIKLPINRGAISCDSFFFCVKKGRQR